VRCAHEQHVPSPESCRLKVIMSNQNPQVADEIQQAKAELAQLKAEKLRLYPPNPHPFAQPDRFPDAYTPDQIAHRNQLVQKIEELEKRLEVLQDHLYRK
jgi:hypothetical protein